MPKVEPKPIQTSDIYQLGEHILICGDATDKVLIEPILKKNPIDLILTDPPYGVAAVEASESLKKQHKRIENDQHQSEEAYIRFMKAWLAVVVPHLQERNGLYIFNADPMVFALRHAMVEAGCTVKQLLIWGKTNSTLNRLQYLSQHELILYGHAGPKAFMGRKDKTVIVCPKTKKNTLHPTMKPLKLLRRLILNSSHVGAIIYDPFGGSGSTLIACEQTQRKCVMVELDPDYCQVIIDRWERLTGQKAVKVVNQKEN